ncbi:exosome complex component RRP45 [Ischnura elegans]|uniref:exosome complex component RRP45 n=1 Tax=Ischnura elegans TaxID=197161 RepID=UPI001ED8A143|nr:exosome complex component RRP45 [Ischnura elegans]
MKEVLLSTCEKEFIPRAVSEGRRLDGRTLLEYRKLRIDYGGDWGCCVVCLGDTKVLAQASCEIQQPKTTRPNEGILFINVEFSPMGAPHFEPGRPSEQAVQCNRLIEKCLKESRCVDLESLCIVSDEKVWQIRVDVSVLNDGGALVDAASIAALASLAHFRRPDVTLDGEEVIVHRDPAERDFLPLSLHHHPVCVSFGLFNGGRDVVVDPAVLEERTAEAQIVVGINAYRELTALHLGGTGSPATNQLVMTCASLAAQRASEVVRIIKETLAKDSEARLKRSRVSFMDFINLQKITTLSQEAMVTALGELTMGRAKDEPDDGDAEENLEAMEHNPKSPMSGMVVESVFRDSAVIIPKGDIGTWQGPLPREEEEEIGMGGPNQWDVNVSEMRASSDSDGGEDEDVQLVAQVSRADKPPMAEIELSGSEEEEVITLEPKEMNLDQGSDGVIESSPDDGSKYGKNKKKKKRKASQR